MPLARVMEQFGQDPPQGKRKNFTCPRCKKKSKAGIFTHDGVEFLKCQSTSCPTGARTMESVSYIAYLSGRSRADAFVDFLKMTGLKESERCQDSTPPERAEPLTALSHQKEEQD